MIKEKIHKALLEIIGEIPAGHEIERIKGGKWGDFSSNIGFLLRKRGDSLLIKKLSEALPKDKDFQEVKLEKGYFNFRLSDEFLRKGLQEAQAADFGRGSWGGGRKILLEFISANPTGPLSVVQARAGALGQALSNLLRYSGFEVKTEYYVNDSGTQVELLLKSLEERIKELKGGKAEIPPGGYFGEYVKEIAAEILEKGIEEKREYVIDRILNQQKASLSAFKIHFDYWVRESSLRPRVKEIVNELQKKGFVQEKEGALFFKARLFGDTEDRVLITKDGRPTYFATDLAYHKDKFERGFSLLVNIWGPDHHGYIPRMKAGIEALGYDPNRLVIIIAQQVSLLGEEKILKMSKREGRIITLDEVREEIGTDTLKFYLLMRKSSQGIQFDLEQAKKETEDNPVYYVQYAHARLNSILKFAAEKGFPTESYLKDPPFGLLGAKERELMIGILSFPDVVKMAAEAFEPHILTYYLIELAEVFHNFYEKERVVSENRELTRARLFLSFLYKKILKEGLNLLGIEAKEKM
ncbi:MAG: arginine--tRNA ligase [candidate division WOR-3 bacterium]